MENKIKNKNAKEKEEKEKEDKKEKEKKEREKKEREKKEREKKEKEKLNAKQKKIKINKDYDGKEEKNLYLALINAGDIKPLIKDAKFNIFFVLPFFEKNSNNIYLSTYEDQRLLFFFNLFGIQLLFYMGRCFLGF